jgi:hypothetical protein
MSTLPAHRQHPADRPTRSNHRVRGLPRNRRNMGASAHMPILRPNRMLRWLAAPAQLRPRRSSAHPSSAKPRKDWSWCYLDNVAFVVSRP